MMLNVVYACCGLDLSILILLYCTQDSLDGVEKHFQQSKIRNVFDTSKSMTMECLFYVMKESSSVSNDDDLTLHIVIPFQDIWTDV